MFIRQNVSIKHVNVPIEVILWHFFEILSCNRAIFICPNFNMMFNIDIKMILYKCRWNFSNWNFYPLFFFSISIDRYASVVCTSTYRIFGNFNLLVPQTKTYHLWIELTKLRENPGVRAVQEGESTRFLVCCYSQAKSRTRRAQFLPTYAHSRSAKCSLFFSTEKQRKEITHRK